MSLRLKKPTKKQFLITVGGLALTVLVAYGAASWLFWANYEQAYERSYRDSAEKIDQVMALPVESSEQRQAKVDRLSRVATESLGGATDVCRPHSAFAWQAVIPALDSIYKQCRAFGDEFSLAIDRLGDLTAYLELEEELSQILNTANKASATAIKDGDWGGAVKAWSRATDDIKSLDKNDNFTPVKEEAAEFTGELAKGWQGLAEANAEQQEVAFVESRSHLEDLYGQIDSVSKLADESSAELANSFSSAWSKVHVAN